MEKRIGSSYHPVSMETVSKKKAVTSGIEKTANSPRMDSKVWQQRVDKYLMSTAFYFCNSVMAAKQRALVAKVYGKLGHSSKQILVID